jgi:hypothetical protein
MNNRREFITLIVGAMALPLLPRGLNCVRRRRCGRKNNFYSKFYRKGVPKASRMFTVWDVPKVYSAAIWILMSHT